MFGYGTNALVGHGRQMFKKVWYTAERFSEKIFRKQGKISNPTIDVAKHEPQLWEGLVTKITARNIHSSLAQQMRSRFSGTLNTGSAQVFGNFHGLRSKVALGFVGVLALHQVPAPEEMHDAVFDDIRGMFTKNITEPERTDTKLNSYDLGAPLGTGVYEAKKKLPDLDDDIEILASPSGDEFGNHNETDCSEVSSAIPPPSDCGDDASSHETINEGRILTNADVGIQCDLYRESLKTANSACGTEIELLLGAEAQYDVITGEQVDEIPPQSFDCKSDIVDDSSLIECDEFRGWSMESCAMCESFHEIAGDLMDSVAPMIFSVRGDGTMETWETCEVGRTCHVDDSDIEVLDEMELASEEGGLPQEYPLFTSTLLRDMLAGHPVSEDYVDPLSEPPDGTTEQPRYDLAVKILAGGCNVNELETTLAQEILTMTSVPVMPVSASGDEAVPASLPAHPNIVQVYSGFVELVPWVSLTVLEEEPQLVPAHLTAEGLHMNPMGFVVMKRYKWTLTEYLSQHTLSVWEKLLLLTQLMEAVHHIHSHGIVHRKIKASNLLIDMDVDNLPHLVLSAFGHAGQIVEENDKYKDLGDVNHIAQLLLGDVSNSSTPADFGDGSLQGLMWRLIQGNGFVHTPTRSVLSILHMLLWQPTHDPLLDCDLARSFKVMPWLQIITASVLLQTRRAETAGANRVTFTLKSLFISRISKEDIEESMKYLLG